MDRAGAGFVGVLFLVMAVFNKPLAERSVASTNAFWGTRFGERMVKFNRASTVLMGGAVATYLFLVAVGAIR